jgi:tight adherence protein B
VIRRGLIACAAAVFLVAAAATPAGAGVQLTGVDVSAYPTVRATLLSSAGPHVVPTLSENGLPVTGLVARNLGSSKAVVLAVDDSRSMAGRPLVDAVAGARAFVAAKPAADQIAIVEFGPRAIALGALSSATIDADSALANVELARTEGTALYDAVELSVRKLRASPLAGRVLIVLTDGRDISSRATLDQAIAAARAAGVAVYAIAVQGAGFDPVPLRALASATGGHYYGTASTAVLADVYRSIAVRLGHTWQLSYVTASRPGDRVSLRAAAAGAGAAASTTVMPTQSGDVTGGAGRSALPTAAFGTGGLLVFAALVGLLVVAAALVLAASRRGSKLAAQLAAHTGGARRTRRRPREQRLAAFAAVMRATEHALGHLRQWKSLQAMLDRGETPLRAAEFLYIMAGSGLALGLLAAVAGWAPLLILLAMVVGAALPFGFAWQRMRKRLRAFEDQLPDILITIAASLKAGHSFKQGLQAVVDEGHPPASDELKRVLTETGLGRQMDDALAEMSERVGSENFEFAITAVTIQRQVGGSLASLFDMVADTVRQRQQFSRKIRSLTAMGRMSAYTLVGLPFLIAGAISVLNAQYLGPLLHSGSGHLLLVAGFVMMAVGAAVLQKIVSFKG